MVALIKEKVELTPLRPARHRMRKEYIEAYFKEVKPSEPREDNDDRNALSILLVRSNSIRTETSH